MTRRLRSAPTTSFASTVASRRPGTLSRRRVSRTCARAFRALGADRRSAEPARRGSRRVGRVRSARVRQRLCWRPRPTRAARQVVTLTKDRRQGCSPEADEAGTSPFARRGDPHHFRELRPDGGRAEDLRFHAMSLVREALQPAAATPKRSLIPKLAFMSPFAAQPSKLPHDAGRQRRCGRRLG